MEGIMLRMSNIFQDKAFGEAENLPKMILIFKLIPNVIY